VPCGLIVGGRAGSVSRGYKDAIRGTGWPDAVVSVRPEAGPERTGTSAA